jgi:PEP-CTERM motif
MRPVRAVIVLIVLVLALCSAVSARADQITSFGQLGTVNQFVATNNGDGTTSLSVNAGVAITNIILGATDPAAVFEFTATSIDAAVLLGGTVIRQTFDGTFSLHNAADTFDYLTGDFGAALTLGGQGGTGALFTSNTAGLAPLTLDTDLAIALGVPQSFALALSNVTPPLFIDSTPSPTIGSFTASFTGTADATPVPEPASMMLLGSGLVAVASAVRRRRLRK